MSSAVTARFLGVGGAIVALVLGAYWQARPPAGLPSPRSPEYQDTVRHFYRGLASLEVGLLEDAQTQFAQAAELAPAEPAVRANLAVVHVGFGNDAEAALELEAARLLAPESSEVAFLQGQLASFRGLVDEAVASFHRALEHDPDHVRARYALAQELERAGGDAEALEAQQQLESILQSQPRNLAVLVRRARVAAQRDDGPALRETAGRLTEVASGWPPLAITQLEALAEAIREGDRARAATAAQLLRNVLVRLPAFREDQAEVSVSAELIADPLLRFLRLPSPLATAAPADETLAYTVESFGRGVPPGVAAVGVVPPSGEGAAAIVAASDREVRGVGAGGLQAAFTFPSGPLATPPTADGLLALDWNGDYRMDLVLAGAGGLRLLVQGEDGGFDEMTPLSAADPSASLSAGYGVWAADTEMDGDLDIVLGPVTGGPWVLRNNADGTWLPVRPFPEIAGLRGFGWGDLDHDGDPDAVLLDAVGRLHLLENRQAGRFDPWPDPEQAAAVVSLAIGDVDADGRLDVVTLDVTGQLGRRSWTDDRWDVGAVTAWPSFPADAVAGSHRVILADLDNNGALDLLASGTAGTRVWLADERARLELFDTVIPAEIFDAIELTGDGRLDLVGLQDGAAVRLVGQGSAGYGWQQIRPRAHIAAGDQRINAFGVGGEIEVRAGLQVQKQVLTGAPAHFGLGTHAQADVTRISWPNGVTQADFEFGADRVIVAEQRLKGSCPWLFADAGTEMRFVTDFLWRSPLGLRINAQETADVAQTEDRVLIRSDQLVAREGGYDLRISGELWETHFFDYISLLVVDHPPNTEVFVDERFAREPVALTATVTGAAHTVTRVWDDGGGDVSDLVRARDGRYVASFERGTHQGVTRDHYLELELDPEVEAHEAVWLLAYGWVYPTDSSINVALGQGQHSVPRGVALEALASGGRWVVIHPDLGFPAGKHKTMVIEVTRLPDGRMPRRLRLRTNLEVYWDWVGFASRLDDAPRDIQRLAPERATLGYRGYSRTELLGPRGLEVPRYEIANTRPRWRDLTGFHTRFGDVRELLAEVDDRYVIMNAGDELRLRFVAPPPPRTGWRRDFVLIGDGWEKDGDFNTTHSKTVGPLPSHARPVYDPDASPRLEDDPVYRRHREDWLTYHTRFVAPDRFLRGLRRPPRIGSKTGPGR